MKTKLLVVLIILLSAITFAQPFGKHQRGPKERIEELERIKLLEVLNLGEEEAVRFFSRRSDFMDSQKELMDKRDEILLEMELAIRKGKDSEDFDYSSAIKQLSDLEVKINDKRKVFLDSLSDILSIEQIAKLVVFESKFRREIRDALMRRGGGN